MRIRHASPLASFGLVMRMLVVVVVAVAVVIVINGNDDM